MAVGALLLSMLLVSPASETDAPFPKGTRQLDPAQLALTISDQGSPTNIRCVGAANLCDVLTKAVAHWKFAPARRDAVAEGANVFLTLGLVAVPKEGGFSLRAIDAELALRGPTEDVLRPLAPPGYPSDALRRGATGVVEVELIIEPGRPTYRAGRRWFNGKESTRRLQLVDAAVDAAERTQVRTPPPELLSECVVVEFSLQKVASTRQHPKACKDSHVAGYEPPRLVTDATQASF